MQTANAALLELTDLKEGGLYRVVVKGRTTLTLWVQEASLMPWGFVREGLVSDRSGFGTRGQFAQFIGWTMDTCGRNLPHVQTINNLSLIRSGRQRWLWQFDGQRCRILAYDPSFVPLDDTA
jgi:hypothetical protein